ncbi:MAG: DUF4255 domain-containing protein, partial [Candidatus Limnocylindrales bacterium]
GQAETPLGRRSRQCSGGRSGGKKRLSFRAAELPDRLPPDRLPRPDAVPNLKGGVRRNWRALSLAVDDRVETEEAHGSGRPDGRMIEVFDETLRELVRREVVNGGGVEIAFDAPTKDWASRRNAPVLNLYLYDIRDDLARREVLYEEVRDQAGRVTDRRPPVHRFRLSYIVTAWTQRPEDEHRLLSACLATFLRHETLMPRELTGPLAAQPHPVELDVALPPKEDRSIADVWTALGGELKPSIDLVAIVPFVVDRHQEPGPPVLEAPRLTLAARRATGEGRTAAPGGRRQVGDAVDSGAGAGSGPESPSMEETVTGGSDAQPGRIVRIRPVGRR